MTERDDGVTDDVTADVTADEEGLPSSVEISVVLPTHNERENLEVLVPTLLDVLSGESCELIVVDDASTDGSVAWLAAYGERDPRVRAVIGDSLLGIGDALRRGYDQARGEIVLSMDADLSFDPELALELLAAIRGGLDLVIGSRHHPDGRYEAPNSAIVRKRLVSHYSNLVIAQFVRVDVSDFSIDCRAIRRSLWARLVLRERSNVWLIEMIVESAMHGARVGEIPITFHDRRFGESKLRLGREVFLYGWRVLVMIGRYLGFRAGLVHPRKSG
jgi:dolichol-phosphate mannosyltransferase